MFLTAYELTKGMPGAPTADLNLTVDAPGQKVSGIVTIKQATSPPLDITINVAGTYFEQNHIGAVTSLYSSDPVIPGKPEFSALLVVPKFGQIGEGWFWYLIGRNTYNSGPVPATPVETAVPANA